MDLPLSQLLRRGLRLALLYSMATLLFLGAIGGAITIALGGKKPAAAPETTVKPATPSNLDVSSSSPQSGARSTRPAVPNGDNAGKPEI
jgi:hypothetical protein